MKALALSLAAVATLAGCGADAGGRAAPTFSALNRDVLEPSCTFACHSGGEFAAGGLDLKSDPYHSLVGVAATAPQCAGSGFARVAPYDPDRSLLWLKVATKITGDPPPCGATMPEGDDRPAIAIDDALTIRAWIEAGATDD